jgi:hypothetical protein
MNNKLTLIDLTAFLLLACIIAGSFLLGLKIDDKRQVEEVIRWKASN